MDAILALNTTRVVDYPGRVAVAAAAATPIDRPLTTTSPAATVSATRADSRKVAQGTPGSSRIIFDPQTSAVVYQSLNPSSGIVIDQVPSQTLLRQRAYVLQALINGKDFSAAVVAAAQGLDTTI